MRSSLIRSINTLIGHHLTIALRTNLQRIIGVTLVNHFSSQQYGGQNSSRKVRFNPFYAALGFGALGSTISISSLLSPWQKNPIYANGSTSEANKPKCFVVYAHEDGEHSTPPILIKIVADLRAKGIDVVWDQDTKGEVGFDIRNYNSRIQIDHRHVFDFVIVAGTAKLLQKYKDQNPEVAHELNLVLGRMEAERLEIGKDPTLKSSVIPLILEAANPSASIKDKVEGVMPRFFWIEGKSFLYVDFSNGDKSYDHQVAKLVTTMQVPEETRCLTNYKKHSLVEAAYLPSTSLERQLPHYVPRLIEEKKVKGFLDQKNIVVVTGPSGCGKSSLAHAVALSTHKNVIRIQAQSIQSAIPGLIALLGYYDIMLKPGQSPLELLEALSAEATKLQKAAKRDVPVIILDNAGSPVIRDTINSFPIELQVLLKDDTPWQSIVTTNEPNWPLATVSLKSQLSLNEAVEMVKKWGFNNANDEKETKAFVQGLGCHPLAITTALQLIKFGKVSFTDYKEKSKEWFANKEAKNREALTKFFSANKREYHPSLAVTVGLTLGYLSNTEKERIAMSSYLYADNIPISLFEEELSAVEFVSASKGLWEEVSDRNIGIHRLVQEEVLRQSTNIEQKSALIAAYAALNKQFNFTRVGHGKRPKDSDILLAANAEQCLSHTLDKEDHSMHYAAAKLANSLSVYYLKLDRISEALGYAERARDHIQTAIRMQSNSEYTTFLGVEVLHNIGTIQLRNKAALSPADKEFVRDIFQESLRLQTAEGEVRNFTERQLGRALIELKEFDKARAIIKDLLPKVSASFATNLWNDTVSICKDELKDLPVGSKKIAALVAEAKNASDEDIKALAQSDPKGFDYRAVLVYSSAAEAALLSIKYAGQGGKIDSALKDVFNYSFMAFERNEKDRPGQIAYGQARLYRILYLVCSNANFPMLAYYYVQKWKEILQSLKSKDAAGQLEKNMNEVRIIEEKYKVEVQKEPPITIEQWDNSYSDFKQLFKKTDDPNISEVIVQLHSLERIQYHRLYQMNLVEKTQKETEENKKFLEAKRGRDEAAARAEQIKLAKEENALNIETDPIIRQNQAVQLFCRKFKEEMRKKAKEAIERITNENVAMDKVELALRLLSNVVLALPKITVRAGSDGITVSAEKDTSVEVKTMLETALKYYQQQQTIKARQLIGSLNEHKSDLDNTIEQSIESASLFVARRFHLVIATLSENDRDEFAKVTVERILSHPAQSHSNASETIFLAEALDEGKGDSSLYLETKAEKEAKLVKTKVSSIVCESPIILPTDVPSPTPERVYYYRSITRPDHTPRLATETEANMLGFKRAEGTGEAAKKYIKKTIRSESFGIDDSSWILG